MSKRLIILFSCAMVMFTISLAVFAHPHLVCTFIPTFVFDNGILTHIQVEYNLEIPKISQTNGASRSNFESNDIDDIYRSFETCNLVINRTQVTNITLSGKYYLEPGNSNHVVVVLAVPPVHTTNIKSYAIFKPADTGILCTTFNIQRDSNGRGTATAVKAHMIASWGIQFSYWKDKNSMIEPVSDKLRSITTASKQKNN